MAAHAVNAASETRGGGRESLPLLMNSEKRWYESDSLVLGGVHVSVATVNSAGIDTAASAGHGGPANAGYSVDGTTDFGQSATWAPYDTTNVNKSITQWGWVRCHAH